MGGDTVIGTLTYKKLYKYGNRYSNCPPPGDYYNGGLKFMRQNIPNKKVYLNVNGIDTLLYDFNLNIGDTLPPSYTEYGIFHTRVVTNIDSILIKSAYRKQFQISIPGDSYTIIEGIGSTIGLIPHFRSEFGSTEVLCVSINNQTVYPDTVTTCTIYTGIKTNTDFSKIDIKVFPNPTSSFITIKTDNVTTFQSASIKDILGRTILTTNQTMIDLSKMRTGVYFIELTTDKGRYMKRIIKN